MAGNNDVLDDMMGTGPSPKLYSKTPLIWYSFLFSPFVGGALMAINLWRLDKKGLAALILIGSLIYSLGVGYFGYIISYPATSRLLVLILNLAGGNILSSPVWRNAIGRTPFQRANPWIPLIFVFGASVVLSLLVYVGMFYFIQY